VDELEKNLQYSTMLKLTDNEEANEALKANVFNMYQGFCLPETTYIDREGLMKLFSDLQLTMSKREFEQYVKKLNLQGKGAAVDFDGFFDGKCGAWPG
jgi:Ca2+-binding EF-hand superfamily protein